MNLTNKKELEVFLNQEIIENSELSGGSGDIVNLITTKNKTKYIFKTGSNNSINSQIRFYSEYSNLPFLPKLINSNTINSELLITYIPPSNSKTYDKLIVITEITKDFISKYKMVDSKDFGFISTFLNGHTFADFLVNQTIDAYSYVKDLFDNQTLENIISLINDAYSDSDFSQKYLLHGDLGFHNFLFSNDNLVGIIDPDPVIGHPIYDLMYAYCSTPNQITTESLTKNLALLSKYYPVNIKKKYDYLTISLFKRISSCTKHHPEDLKGYMSIWNWLNSIKK